MGDAKQQMKENFIKYASYVILDRAIPDVVDGLKPVQRRILFTLFNMDDGKLHKVANVAGQTMALHPHGDAPIVEALVNLANKNFLLDRQGNFGNLYTGDPAAAARYIETRLSELARETLFNPSLTETLPSYDGRNQEPVTLPAKIPLLLMQGAEGIAVGMSTRILPHNFVELLEAQISILEKKPFKILPDFPTGGFMDASDYSQGRGRVKLRAKIDIPNDKTIVIREICYGTTTESVINSIDEAAKKGKIRIESIHDFTASKPEIEIKLPRGQHAEDVIQALYAYTDCEVSLNSQLLVIRDSMPWETTVDEILKLQTENLQGYLRRELEIEQGLLEEKIFQKTLERIFIENRLYKPLEELPSLEMIHSSLASELARFRHALSREPTQQDQEKLLEIPIRRITRYDIDKNLKDIEEIQKRLKAIAVDLQRIAKVAIDYLRALLKKYGGEFARKTKIKEIEEVDIRAIAEKQIKVWFDAQGGFIGTKVQSEQTITCSNYDKLLLMYSDGTYKIISIPEKQYIHQDGKKIAFVGIADKKTVLNVLVQDPQNHIYTAKRFIIAQYIMDKEYRYFDEGLKLELISSQPYLQLSILLAPQPKQKVNQIDFNFNDVSIKGVTSKGIRVTNKKVKKFKILPAQEHTAATGAHQNGGK